jgi:adenylate kinase family enzyme
MVKTVFVMGRTGSGKSTTIRYLADEVQRYGWTVSHFDDYPILREMFLADTEKRQFEETEHNGFEVTDPTVFDKALEKLEQKIRKYKHENARTLVSIEFSRNNYCRALGLFSEDFLSDAHFLFVSTDLLTCMERTCIRGIQSQTKDDFFVKETVLLHHFACPYMPPSISSGRVTFLHNMDTLETLKQRVKDLAPGLLMTEPNSMSLEQKDVNRLALATNVIW